MRGNNTKQIYGLINILIVVLGILPNVAKAGITMNKSDTEEPGFSFNFDALPGEQRKGNITIQNTGENEVKLILYGVDATSSGRNAFAAKSQQQEQMTMGKWVKFETESITLAPKESKKIQFTVTIPKETPPGTYAGAVGATIENNNTISSGAGAISVARTILPVYVKIPGEETFSYDWKGLTYEAKQQPHLTTTITNTGNTIIAFEGTITLKTGDQSGKTLKTIPVETTMIYQGETSKIEKYLDAGMGNGIFNNYSAELSANISKVDITTNEKIDVTSLKKSVDFSINHLEYIFFGIFAFIIIIGTTGFVVIRKYLTKKSARSYTIKPNETLDQIGKQEGINWKKIASLNKLKPPYTLKAGDTILIPKHPKN